MIYLRVSTKEQAEKDPTEAGFSIAAQREACGRRIRDEGLELVDEYVDKGESARTADRPRLRALLRRRGMALVSVTENLDETASGRLVEGIHALMVEFYSANLATEVRKDMGQKAKLGSYPHKAPIGYLNVREPIGGRQVARIVANPERAPLVKVAFELYATGDWTIEHLAEEMAHRCLRYRGRKGRNPAKAVTVSGMAHLLGHRAYAGIVEWDGVEYERSHEPLVDRATFDNVQELLVCGVCGRRHRLPEALHSGRPPRAEVGTEGLEPSLEAF